jgi:hypothetical protein
MNFDKQVQVHCSFSCFNGNMLQMTKNTEYWIQWWFEQTCFICKGMFLIEPSQSSHCSIDVTKPNNDKLKMFYFLPQITISNMQNLLKLENLK